MDQIVLFGDSITQFSGDQNNGFAFKAAMENAYIRKLDVVNRGFSGYNTSLALRILPQVIPPPSPDQPRIRLFVVFLGANDARLPGTPPIDQCVSLNDFKANMRRIIDHPSVVSHRPEFLLVTPPPIDERLCEATDREKGFSVSRRSAAHTAAYAQVVRDLGEEYKIPVVDIWTAFLQEAGLAGSWDGKTDLPGSKALDINENLRELLNDGLHFTGRAYKVMYEQFMKVIAEELPHLRPEKIRMVFPDWKDEQDWKDYSGPRRIP
ncbi:GDSL esterase/lipase [Sphaceloma murrayae]|uniref:GDSL esterase/lipase n=1 Tax=Sphaceloma murrayae TaxID=2082308 RepID=A0A2K1QQU7_9PEZI|nr:GDSL esterase/lipase [Sphaceloma murrayae]